MVNQWKKCGPVDATEPFVFFLFLFRFSFFGSERKECRNDEAFEIER